MAISETEYAQHLSDINDTLTAKNIEAYNAMYPGSYPDPDPSYAELLTSSTADFNSLTADMLSGQVPVIHAAVLTTGAGGTATITYPTMVNPVVVGSVVSASGTVVYTVVVQSVSATSATVRVMGSGGLTVLGLAVLGVPTATVGASVHVMVYDAG